MPHLPRSETRQVCLELPRQVADRFERAAHNRGQSMCGLAAYLFGNLNPDFAVVPLSQRPIKKATRAFNVYHQKIVIWEKWGGLTIYQIADLWGCNKSTVARIVNREGSYTQPLRIQPLPLSVADCEDLREIRRGDPVDNSFAKLGKRFGVSHQTAFNIFNRVGVYRYYGQPKQRSDDR